MRRAHSVSSPRAPLCVGRRTVLGGQGLVLCLALIARPLPARAQPEESPASPPSVLADEKARQTFKEGIEAFDRRDFEAARVAFLQTFALKPSVPVVRRNLGLAEIFSGHYLEGARRLARVIHTTGEGSAEDRARMLDSLKKAEAHLERITIEVNEEGAEISVDRAKLGTSPLPFVWYVAPGPYHVRIAKPGFEDVSLSRVARAGAVQHLRITLFPAADAAQPSSEAPPPPTGVASGPAASPWIIAAGAVATAAGIGAGIGFSLAAQSNGDKVDRLSASLAEIGCSGSTLPRCLELSDAAREHDAQVRWATASFIAAGVMGLGTVLYAIVAGLDESPSHGRSPAAGMPNIAFGPSPSGGELRLEGAF